MQKNIRRYWPIFLLPTLAAFLIGFVIPFIQGLYLSLCKFTTINKTTFVGLSNYVKAFQDEQFAHASALPLPSPWCPPCSSTLSRWALPFC